MISKLKKYALALIVGAGLTPSQPLAAATVRNNIELVTAFLRGPAAYYEFKLRNDHSRSAYLKKTVIHAIRFINDLGTLSKRRSILSTLFDFANITTTLTCASESSENCNVNRQIPCLGDDYTKLGLYVLPMLETLCALARTQQISPWFDTYYRQDPKALIANIGLDLTRITQCFLISLNNRNRFEKNDEEKPAIILLLLTITIAIYLEVKDFQKTKKDGLASLHQAEQYMKVTNTESKESNYTAH